MSTSQETCRRATFYSVLSLFLAVVCATVSVLGGHAVIYGGASLMLVSHAGTINPQDRLAPAVFLIDAVLIALAVLSHGSVVP